MQSIQFRYAQWFNHRYERDGPVFRGRFRSVLVTSDEQLVQVGRYIHRNPLAFVRTRRSPRTGGRASGRSSAARVPRRGCRAITLLGAVRRRRRVGSEQSRRDGPAERSADSTARRRRTPLRRRHRRGRDAAVFGVRPDELCGLGRGRPQPCSDRWPSLMCVELRVGIDAASARRYGLSERSSVRDLARRGRVARPRATRRFADCIGRRSNVWVRRLQAGTRCLTPRTDSAGEVDVSGDEVLELLLLAAGADDLRVVGQGALVE